MNTTRPTIAVVDDDPAMLESLSDLLAASGYDPIGFPSATALLETGLQGLSLIVADIGMPGMDGFDLREIARQKRPELPVFLITGRHELLERDRVNAVRDVFRKPFDTAALLAAIAQVLHR